MSPSAVHLFRRQSLWVPAVTVRFCADHATPARAAPVQTSSPTAPDDHRALGVQQQLWTHSVYSPGTPIFLPAGTRIFNRLVDFLRSQYVRYGFDEVITPTIYKKSLWARSGHLENYADNMYTVTGTKEADKEAVTGALADEEEFGLKPMNCPGHCLIFASQRWSYRDLPVRYADFGPLHRNEVTGALSGLTRVRRFHQDDGHIFCRPSQITEEIRKTLEFVDDVYGVLSLGDYRLLLSTRPEDKYIGSLEDWEQAETALKQALDTFGKPWSLNEGDGAFYGPKIDILIRDSDGKEHQTATIQLDFQMPTRFDLHYQAPAPDHERRGEKTEDPALLAETGLVRPVMIHRAVLGSVERLMALLVEKYGKDGWPVWLNPRQVAILTINDKPQVVSWAKEAADILRELSPPQSSTVVQHTATPNQIHVDVDDTARPLQAKIRAATAQGYATFAVIGQRDVEAGTLTFEPIRSQHPGNPSRAIRTSKTPTELLQVMKQMIARHE
jgi:threonyl-tRNA synthetase